MTKFRTKLAAAVVLVATASLLLTRQDPAQAVQEGPSAFVPKHAADTPPSNPLAKAPKNVQAVLDSYCIRCHGPNKQKGSIRLDTLATLKAEERSDLLNMMHESIRFEEMPPPKEKQPTKAERKLLDDWIAGVLKQAGSDKLEGKLKKPEYGNYVDHQALFSGKYKDLPGYTSDRRWLISEFIFDAKFQRILENRTTSKRRGNRVTVVGGHSIRGLSLANPFLLPNKSGVRYYANTDLTGGHLSTMLTNAQKTSIFITENMIKSGKRRDFLPAIKQVLALEDEHEATLASRREFLDQNMARVCEDLYGQKNKALLPKFVPVKLNPIKKLEKGEKYKRLPVPVAGGSLSKIGGSDVFYRVAMDPANKNKSDQQIADICERIWFYQGDYKRDIQGRLALLREYISDFRKNLDKYGRKHKRRAYKPLADSEMKLIEAAILKNRNAGDFYIDVIDKCMAQWEQQFKQQRIDAGPPSDELLRELIGQLFVQILERRPAEDEADQFLALTKGYITKLGNRKAVQKLIQTVMLTSEFVYRQEFGTGKPDEHGRRMLSPRDASYAIAYALTDQSPDKELVEAAKSGRLNSREDYKREVTRILNKRDVYYQIDKNLADRSRISNATNTAIRKLRFFREFFGYPKAITIFKDEKRFGGDRFGSARDRLLSEADRIVEHILEKDQNVFEELLTTEKFYVYHDGDNERMKARSDEIKRIYEYFKDKDWKSYKKKDLLKHADFLRTVDMRMVNPDKPDARNRQGDMLKLFKMSMRSIVDRMDNGQKSPAPFDLYRGYGNDFMTGYNVAKFWSYELGNWDYATHQPAKVPNRKGILTHPAWLIAFAQNTETDPVHRGKWVREKLLAGTIPDVPITVDAQIPEDHDKTLRARLASATETDYCWKCHKLMNPLGYTFEAYDDFGRYRTEEPLEYAKHLVKKGPEQRGDHLVDTRDIYETLPIDATGALTGTGDESLDGKVSSAIDLAERLGKSRRVRQSIIRHAFRYFMGRNEVLSDSKTLIDAEQAYIDSGGSFDAVIISLLTSDSFIYRKAIKD